MTDTPQEPPGDARRLLVEKWREAATHEFHEMGNTQYAQALDQCADELDAALSPEAQSSNDLDKGLIARTMEALESGATTEQRERAWNQLRERYFPVETALSPEAVPLDAHACVCQAGHLHISPEKAKECHELLTAEAVPSAPAGLPTSLHELRVLRSQLLKQVKEIDRVFDARGAVIDGRNL